MKLVWATFHYWPTSDEQNWTTWPKPKQRLCVVRHGMIKGPDHTAFVWLAKAFRAHFRISDPQPLRPDEAKRLLAKVRK